LYEQTPVPTAIGARSKTGSNGQKKSLLQKGKLMVTILLRIGPWKLNLTRVADALKAG
jgi:hypothetical protein